MYKIKLSPFQKIFFNEWQIDPQRSDYNIVSDQFLYGTLCPDKLNVAIQKFASAYVLFNSRIEFVDNEPAWVKASHTAHLDFFETPISDKAIYDYVSEPFNLLQGPLYRFLLIQYTENKYRFVVVFHHILVSAFAVENGVFEVLMQDYQGDVAQLQYTHAEQIALLNTLASELSAKVNRHLEQNKKFWQTKLNDVEVLNLKFLHLEEKKRKQFESAIKEYRFDLNETAFIQTSQLSRKYGITPYIFGQIIFACLLYRYTGQKKIAINYPFSIKEGAEFIYGAQVNTSFMIYDFNHVNYFSDIAAQIREFIKEVKNKGKCDRRYCPISEVIDIGNKDLLDVAFIQTNLKDILFKFESIESVEVNQNFNIDLNNKLLFEQEIKDNKIKFRVKYRPDEINRNLLTHFVEAYTTLYDAIIKDELKGIEQKPLSSYSILNPEDFHKIVYQWNNTEAPYPKDKTIQALFEEQVKKTPQAIALKYENKQFTYEALNARANQLAAYLRKQYGVQPNELIGVCLDKSEWLIVVLLGVLKSGAAYVPIDPNYPAKRIEYILNDIQAKVILTTDTYLAKFEGIDTLALDGRNTAAILEKESKANSRACNQSQDLAYVIYTSGTTGMPKGVMIEHRNLVSFMIGFAQFPLNNQISRNTLSVTHYVFDIFVLEFLLPLLSGHTLHLFDLLSPKTKIKIQDYDCVQVTPSTLELLVENIDYEMQSLEEKYTVKVLIGGETVTASSIHQLQKVESKLKQSGIDIHFEIINVYGPTETTIWSISGVMDPEDLSSENKLGYPLRNECVYILDESLNPLPIGVIGEIHIGGSGVSRGYLHNSDLTHEKFIANPFLENNKMLYKTGDLGRWHPDGSIEFIGRKDFQVKLHGHRIELAEIESRLNTYPDIKQSLVILLKSEKNTPHLIAYYTANKKLLEENLRTYLSESLPHFMLPNKMIYLSKFPLTSSGKIDRNKLATYDVSALVENTYVAPRNKLETMVCKAFSDCLGIEVGLYDDFFKLGGTSILAIQVVSKLRKDLNFSIEVGDIFKYRTVFQLVSNVQLSKKAHYGPELHQSHKKRVLSFAQERLWILSQYENANKAYNVPFIFKLKPECDRNILVKSLEAVVNRHEILRTIIQKDKRGNAFPEVLAATWSSSGRRSGDSGKISCKTEAPVEVMISNVHFPKIADSQKILDSFLQKDIEHFFDLSQELPLKISLYAYKNEYYLSLIFHHIAFDGWSGDILVRDLMEYYRYYSQDQKQSDFCSLSDISIQYTDFALWQRHYLKTKAISEQVKFWEKKLQYYEPLNLPIDKQRPMVFNYTGKTITFSLSSKLSTDLRACAKALGISLYSLMLSAFYLLLRIYSNQNDIVLGTMVSNRHYKNVDNLVGFFVNMLPLRQKIQSDFKLTDFVYAVFDEIIEAQQNQDLPFEKLVDKLNIANDLGKHPIFQVIFGVQNFGLGYQDVLLPYPHTKLCRTAKFDLSLVFNDGSEKLSGMLEYQISLFEEKTIKNYIKTYQIILKQLSQIREPKFKEMYIRDVSYLDKNGKKLTHNHSLDMVIDWKDIYDLTYSKLDFDNNNFIGWNSSYTGTPISLEQMREWQNETLDKINQLSAKRILEIGSGSGLLLYELIKKSEFYYAFDFSERAIQYNQKNVKDLGCYEKFQGVIASADEIKFEDFFEKYDTVILNSVVQYFPSLEYLDNVLIRAISNIDSSGQIFIGDVRDFRLLECFAYSLLNFRKGIVNISDIEYFTTKEKELLVSPEYFLFLKKKLSSIVSVELLPKLGSAINEMNSYRYDVVLHIDKKCNHSISTIRNDQFEAVLDIEHVLKNETEQELFIKYPNYRIAMDYVEYKKMYHQECDISIESALKVLSVQQLARIFDEYGYKVKLYLDAENPLYFNIIAQKNEEFKVVEIDYPKINLNQSNLSNDPLQNMILIEAVEITPISAHAENAALNSAQFNMSHHYIAPTSKLEKSLCKIFAQILDMEESKISIRDNFFQIGGNSLLAIKLTYKINSKFKCNIQIVDIFTQNTIQDLAFYLSDLKSHSDCVTHLNKMHDKLNMFMVHPAFASSEVYAELAHKFSDQYSCYGLDNYNLKHNQKIEDIKELAEKYLSSVRFIRKQTHQENEPYVFLGWSLGGQIALHMASILEQNGEKDIYLILIDSVYPDRAFSTLLSQVVLDQTQLRTFTQEIGLDLRYMTKVKNNFQYDLKLSFQGTSIKLKHSKLLLFKAMKKEAVVFLKNYKPLKEYVGSLTYNNLDKAVDAKNIHLVRLNDSNHFNLLEQDELIYQNTVEFIDE